MRYDYHFYTSGNREVIGATIVTDVPLPHIQIGHKLQLEVPSLSTKAGHYWEIQGVEVYLFLAPHGNLKKLTTHVVIHEQERLLER